MSSEIIIRFANIDDAKGIFETHERSIQEVVSKDYSTDQIDTWFPKDRTPQHYADKIPDREYIVAERDGQIVGVARIDQDYVNIFYTHPEFVGIGVGKALWDYIEKVIKQNNHNKIRLNSTVTARTFYQKMGMKIIEQSTYRFDNGIEVDIFKMEKDIA